VLLEGVAPVNTKLPLQFAKGAQEALDRVFEDCAADGACRSAFPNPKKEFAEVLSRFKNGAISFEITNLYTGQKELVRMLRGNFVVRLLSLLYSPGSAARIPFLIHRAFQNDYEPFAVAAIRADAAGSISRGMYLTVTCSESIPFITERDIEQATKGTFLGDYRTRSHIAGCKGWPRASISPKFLEPVRSDVPVLMISGTIDPATPYWLGQSAVEHLPNGRQLLVNNTGHAFGHPCLQDIAA
jgi:pimeloyl-ACP methyl ester carboxylesterase